MIQIDKKTLQSIQDIVQQCNDKLEQVCGDDFIATIEINLEQNKKRTDVQAVRTKIKALMKHVGLSYDAFIYGSGNREHTKYKGAIIYYLKNKGFTYEGLAEILNDADHSNSIYHYKKFKEQKILNPELNKVLGVVKKYL